MSESQSTVLVYDPPTDDVFRLFQTLIFRHAGIHLGDEKKALLQARLTRRMRELRLPSFISYYRYATKSEHRVAETQMLIDLITTNETSFFREPRHFDVLREKVIPAWIEANRHGRRRPQVRVWSAACSTGEEPYSIAMLLLAELGRKGWSVEVLATDISNRVLSQASQAVWPIDRAAQIPEEYRTSYMLRGVGNSFGLMKASKQLREVVRFGHCNLVADTPDGGPFDLVFCRNVMIYFAPETKRRVVDMLLGQLTPGGLLFLGHAETLADATENVRCVGPNIYSRRSDA